MVLENASERSLDNEQWGLINGIFGTALVFLLIGVVLATALSLCVLDRNQISG